MVYLRRRLAMFIRQRRGAMPQREFARRIGVAQSTIMRIENQEQNVTLKTLEQLCEAFKVEVADLFPLPSSTGKDYRHQTDGHRPVAVHEPDVRRPRKSGSSAAKRKKG